MPINGRCMCGGEGWDGCEPEMTIVHDAGLRRGIAADSASITSSSPFSLADSAWARSSGISLGGSVIDSSVIPRGPGSLPNGSLPMAALLAASYDRLPVSQRMLEAGDV